MKSLTALKATLEDTLLNCDLVSRRYHDPVELVWRYESPADQEVVALITSTLAYGRVELLKRAVDSILRPMGDTPADFLRHADTETLLNQFSNFVYRMTRGDDLIDLLWAIGDVLREYGSLEQAYATVRADTHIVSLTRFVYLLRERRLREALHRGFKFLLPDPQLGGACKRLHLFFRWVVRGPDDIDLGLWKAVTPAELIMPMDTHTSRICRYIGLTEYNQAHLKMALQVTENLRQLDPRDPLRFDFALCHLGISRQCIHKRSDEHCPPCPINTLCTL